MEATAANRPDRRFGNGQAVEAAAPPAPIAPSFRLWRSSVTVEELSETVARYLGQERMREAFDSFATAQRISLDPTATRPMQPSTVPTPLPVTLRPSSVPPPPKDSE